MAVSIMRGSYTVELANKLKEHLNGRYNVYCSHGDFAISTSFYNKLNKSNRLSFVDILVTYKNDYSEEKPIVLIEFEETNDSPKTIIGDIYSLLFARYVHLKNVKEPLQLDRNENIIVSVHIKPNVNIYAKMQRLYDIQSAIIAFNPKDADRVNLLGSFKLDDLIAETEANVFDFIRNFEMSNQDDRSEVDDWNRLTQIIKECTIDTGIKDLAQEHDHYLYGTPNKSNLKEV